MDTVHSLQQQQQHQQQQQPQQQQLMQQQPQQQQQQPTTTTSTTAIGSKPATGTISGMLADFSKALGKYSHYQHHNPHHHITIIIKSKAAFLKLF